MVVSNKPEILLKYLTIHRSWLVMMSNKPDRMLKYLIFHKRGWLSGSIMRES